MGFKIKTARFWEAQDTPPNYFNIPVEETRYYFFNWWFWTTRRTLTPDEAKASWKV